MKRRLGWAGLVVGLMAGAACVGDTPASAGGLGPESDAATAAGDAAGSTVLHPAVAVEVGPIVVLRGASVRVPFTLSRVDTSAAVTVELRNMPVGVTAGAPVTLAPDTSSGELTLATLESAAYGDFTLQLGIVSADLPEPLIRPISLQVRGVPGSLDTSFGINGHAPIVPEAAIGEVMVDREGRYVIAGGYNAGVDNMLFARLTPSGQMDPSFGEAGLRRFSAPYGHIGHFEVTPGYYRRSLLETPDGYSLTAYLEPNATNTNVGVHAEVSYAGALPSFVPTFAPTGDLGSINGGTHLVRDDTGFFSFRHGCSIERRNDNSELDVNWGVAGAVNIPESPCFISDVMDTGGADGRLFALVTLGVGASARVRIVTIARSNGEIVDPTSPSELAPDPVHLSRPNAAGKVLVTYGTAVREINPADASVTRLKGNRYEAEVGPVTAKSSLAFYFADGNVGVVSFDTRPHFHRLSPTGDRLDASTGIELDEPAFEQYQSFVEVFPDARGGLVVLYPSGTADPLLEHWTIKRFWL